MSELLQINNLNVSFGSVRALTNINLSVHTGEIRGLIGPNGAGKTTLINAVTGVIRPAEGTVNLGGIELTRKPSHVIASLGIGRTFQHAEIFTDQTVLNNVLLGLGNRFRSSFWACMLSTRRASLTEQQARCESMYLLEMFGLAEVAYEIAGSLSYGTLKRLDMARAFAGRPKVLLLDEPVSGMSESEADAAIRTARSLAKKHGITMLVIEHNMRVMMQLADRITVMQFGTVIAEGTPLEVQSDPAVLQAYLGEEVQSA